MPARAAEPKPLQAPGLPNSADVAPTEFIDSESDVVRELAARAKSGARDEHEVAARLFAAVRDGVRYDPFTMPSGRSEYRASGVLRAGSGYCIQKSVALTAAARAAGIPSRLGFADVKNHLQSERLREAMGTDLFVWHGYSTLFVGGRWTKASCAFNAELCARFGVPPLDYDGREDALLHPFTADGSQYMEYVRDRGVYVDLPLRTVLDEFREVYGWTASV
ncbi:MAG TPA: transglutaminase-like domain-containing protein [Solirubrobacteraceae bacterium]|nr:transglutaminase-like domain-containing protein [Solirubrobacteraceae bacterium]